MDESKIEFEEYDLIITFEEDKNDIMRRERKRKYRSEWLIKNKERIKKN